MTKAPDDLTTHQTHYQEIFDYMKAEPYANHLGMKLIEMGPGTATAELTIEDHMLNNHQTVHGAIIFSLADYVFAVACNSYGRTAVGLNTTVNFMAPAVKGARITATATEERRNYRTSWYNIHVECDGELIATMEALAYRKSEYFIGLNPKNKG